MIAYSRPTIMTTTMISISVKPAAPGREARGAAGSGLTSPGSLVLAALRGDVVVGAFVAIRPEADDLEVTAVEGVDHVLVVPRVLPHVLDEGLALAVGLGELFDRVRRLVVADLVHPHGVGDVVHVGSGLLHLGLFARADDVRHDQRRQQAEDDDHDHDLDEGEAALVEGEAVPGAAADAVGLVHGWAGLRNGLGWLAGSGRAAEGILL